ncbi:hypothetical protein SI65_09510 [Aspergillus cristatus]|uniref:TLDc domain-containing protein n=1 Tax=Aspergillus cristatus TaxID=573508 RepID=A0A1E3B251_ASPCR|nr:hypothetical protein SI65_09510 [Aspergillus cristatus]
MFQSLATTEGGKKLLFDIVDWTKQAEHRAVEFPPSRADEAMLKVPNCDEEGDEMFHDNLLPDPDKTVLTFPILTQLCISLNENTCWEDFKLLCSYNDPVEIPTIIEKVTHIHEAVVLLFSGSIAQTDEDILFGAFIPEPCKDGNEIQERDEHRLDLLSCFLFQLSPVHDVSWGNVGRPGWSVIGNELCFGDKDNGAALVLNNGMKAATLIWNVEQKDPAYTASAWRGKDTMQVEVKAIEIWNVLDEGHE